MLLDVDSVARALGGVSPDTVRRLIREGAIPASRIGRRVLVHEKDLEAYAAALRPARAIPRAAR